MKIMRVCLFLSGCSLFLFTGANLFFANFNFGFIMLFFVSCVLMLYGVFFTFLIKIKCLTYGILAALLCFVGMAAFLFLYGHNDTVTYEEDALVVLGAGIRGEEVSRFLSYRLDKAAEYSAKNPKAVIIVSGAQGPQEDITEALAMERYLMGKGIPQERIIKEEAATSTYENFAHAKAILDKVLQEPYQTAFITNDFHVFRAAQVAERLGLHTTHAHAKIEWYGIPMNYARECVAIVKYWLLGV